MPKGVTGSGGVDTSALDGLVSRLESVLDTQNKINQTKLTPKADDSEVKKLKKSINELWDEARNTKRTDLELWNTKTVKKDIDSIKKEALNSGVDIEKFIESFDISKISSESISKGEKYFLKFYAFLETYSNKFGQEISSIYKNIFDSIFNNSDVFKQDYLKEYYDNFTNKANQQLNSHMSDITYDANENYVKQQSDLLKQQREEAKRTADAVREAERQKREEYRATRDRMMADLKSAMDEMSSSAKDGEFLSFDEESWGVFQQKVFDLIQLMSEMGFEVKDIEDSFGRLQDKVYISPDHIKKANDATSEISTEAKEASENAELLGNTLKSSVNDESLKPLIDVLEQISKHLLDIRNTLGSVDDENGFTNIISSVDILLGKLDEVNQKVGTGVYNVQINQGVDRIAQEREAATKDYLRSTMSRYKNAYSKVVGQAGSEEKLFAYINNVVDFKGGIDQLYETFGSSNVSQLESAESQIYRYMDFFKILKQAMGFDEFGLDLSSINLPTPDDSYFRSKLREKSGLKDTDEIINLDDEKVDLTEIVQYLSDIRDLISDISKKDLFGESLEKISGLLDSVIEKFKEITTQVQVINNNPIDTNSKNSVNVKVKNKKPIETHISQTDLDNVTESAKQTAEAKKSIKEANEELAASTKPTEASLNSESSSLDNVTESAKQTAKAKESVAEANEELNKSENKTKTKKSDNADSDKEREKSISRYIKLVNERNKLEIKKIKNGDNSVRDEEIAKIDDEITELKKLNFTEEENERITRGVATSAAALKDALNLKDLQNQKALNKYISDIDNAMNSLDTLEKKRKYIPEFSSEIDELRSTLARIQGDSDTINIVSEKELQELAEAKNRLKQLTQEATLAENKLANENSIQKNLAKINDVLSKNTKRAFKATDVYQDYLKLQNLFQNFDTSKPQSELNDLITELLKVDARFKELGDDVKGGGFLSQFSHRLSDMNAKFFAQYFSFQDIIRYARQAFTTIQDLNVQMVELAKVSEQSLEQIKGDFQSYADTAKDLGSTISDTIAATADWARFNKIDPLYGNI